MLPPGHIAGGYLAAKIASYWLPQLDQPKYLALTSFFAFFPDLDMFYSFFLNKKMIMNDDISHRKFVSHAPLLHLSIFILWYFVFPSTRLIAWTYILGTWSHFLIDTIDTWSIRWLWPFSQKGFSANIEDRFSVTSTSFFSYWIEYLRKFLRTIQFRLELSTIIIAILVFLFTKH